MSYIIEEWKPVVGYEGWYEVSSFGHVRRCRAGKGTYAGRVLKPRLAGYGYPCVNLSREGDIDSHYIHDLVAMGFIGEKPPGMTVNHKDTDKLNCRADNLEYLSGQDNYRHAYEAGRIRKGSDCYQATLTESQVKEIRGLAGSVSYAHLATRHNTTPSNIYRIVRRLNWRHI